MSYSAPIKLLLLALLLIPIVSSHHPHGTTHTEETEQAEAAASKLERYSEVMGVVPFVVEVLVLKALIIGLIIMSKKRKR